MHTRLGLLGRPILSFDYATFLENGEWMNREQILSRLARNHMILHSMPPQGRGQGTDADRWPCQVLPGVWTYRNHRWFPRIYRNDAIERFVSRLRAIHRKLFLYRLDRRRPILYIWHPFFVSEVGRYRESLVIYHIYDDYRSFPGADERIIQWELSLLRKADFVFSMSRSLAEVKEKECNRKIIFIPNGVDFELFESCRKRGSGCPEDIAAIPHPRIAYIGRINKKVDIRLVKEIAERRPNWNMIFIGPIVADNDPDLFEKIYNIPNIYFLGRKQPKELPYYYMNIDISIMCYKKTNTEWYRYGYPLKMHEAFAAGKPVISSDLLEVRAFKDYLKIANGLQEWIEAIETILRKPEIEKQTYRTELIELAKRNSWNSRVSKIEQILSHRGKL